jgi:nitrogen regulatory protein PII
MQLFKWFPEPNRRVGTPVAVICHFVILYFVAKEFPGNCAHLDLCDEEDQLMKMVSAVIRPHRLQHVKEALADAGIVGLTVTDVRGAGRQKGQIERYRGSEYSIDLIPKIKLEIATEDEQAEVVIRTIRESAYTGEIGDGKIFIHSLEDAMRIRTGDRGESSL